MIYILIVLTISSLAHAQSLRSCTSDEFRCKSGLCIPKEWKCDRDVDCYDGDDEAPSLCTEEIHEECPPNAVYHITATSTKCLWLTDKKYSFDDAESFCSYDGGHLAEVPDDNANEFILNKFPMYVQDGAWVGIDDRDKEGQYRDIENNLQLFKFWAPSEPSGNGRENCVMYFNKAWHDRPCITKHKGICSRTLVDICPPNAAYRVSNGVTHCYWPTDSTQDYNNAEVQCRGSGGRLALVPNHETNTFILNQFPQAVTYGSWIGINDQETEGYYKNSNGNPQAFYYWDRKNNRNEPTGRNENCVIFVEKAWHDVPCSRKYKGICSKTPSETCPSNAKYHFTGKHVQCLWTTDFQYNFDRANSFCEVDGGTLASVPDAATHDLVVGSYPREVQQGLWIGINDRDNEGDYRDMKGVKQKYLFWEKDPGFKEPTGTKSQNCINYFDKDWHDADCMVKKIGLCSKPLTEKTKHRRVCYFTNWAQYREQPARFTPQNIQPELCTHLIFAFAKLEGTKLDATEWNDPQLYKEFINLKKRSKGLKILLAVGGWNAASKSFSSLVASPEARKIFAISTIDYLRKHGFDGVDLDWEYPTRRGGSPKDREGFAKLVMELKEEFISESRNTSSPRLLLSAAVPTGKEVVKAGYDVITLSTFLDFINLMTYDFHGGWESEVEHNSPLYSRSTETELQKTMNTDWAARNWVNNLALKNKINIGIPTYGRSYILADPKNKIDIGSPAIAPGRPGKYTQETGFLSYYEICKMQEGGQGKVYRHQEHQVPYFVLGDTWIGYDDEISVSKKADWLVREGYGGSMIWSLSLDDFAQFCSSSRTPFPLASAIADTIRAHEVLYTDPTTSVTIPTNTTDGKGQTTRPSGFVTTTTPSTSKGTSTRKPKNINIVIPYIRKPKSTTKTPTKSTTVPSKPTTPTKPTTPKRTTTIIIPYRRNKNPSVRNPAIPRKIDRHRLRFKAYFNCRRRPYGYYPDVRDCQKYFVCHMGRTFHYKCPSNLRFNPIIRGCDWGNAVNCRLP